MLSVHVTMVSLASHYMYFVVSKKTFMGDFSMRLIQFMMRSKSYSSVAYHKYIVHVPSYFGIMQLSDLITLILCYASSYRR